jgi:hypothetical protein
MPGEREILIAHQIELSAAGGSYLTLADLWPQRCRAVVVGVNPAPSSVGAALLN